MCVRVLCKRVALLEQGGVLLGVRPHDLEHELHCTAFPQRDGVHRCTKDAHIPPKDLNRRNTWVFIDLQRLMEGRRSNELINPKEEVRRTETELNPN